MKQPKVSVIIPVYKVEKYLVQCLDSIVGQTLKDIEIIIVDEGDKDACRYIIDHYEQADKRVIAIHEKNGGYGASVNKGFDIAKGEYIGIVESDDFIAPEMYEEMYNYAKKLDADIVKTPYYEYYSEKRKSPKIISCPFALAFSNIPENKLISVIDYPEFMGTHPSIWSAIYKKSYITKNNIKFETAKGAGYVDQTIKLHLYLNTNKLSWLNSPYYFYRCDNPDASDKNFNFNAMLKRWQEVHKLFNQKYKGDYNKIAPHLIKEEYICTILKTQRAEIIPDVFQTSILKQNFSFTSNEIIQKTPMLTEIQKKILLNLKKNSTTSIFKYNKSEKNPNFKIYVLKFIPLLSVQKKNGNFKLKLFNHIPLIKVTQKGNSFIVSTFEIIPLLKIKKKI